MFLVSLPTWSTGITITAGDPQCHQGIEASTEGGVDGYCPAAVVSKGQTFFEWMTSAFTNHPPGDGGHFSHKPHLRL
jgi:hypothetical protein